MSTITTRAGKGSPLTNSEVDQNFTNLNNDKLESGDNVSTLVNDAGYATTSYVDTAESDAVSTANAYTDTRETAITTAYQTYADQAEADAKSYADGIVATEATARSTGDSNTLSSAKSYTDTAISNLVDTAPSTLDTLNELAAALGDDPNFATTVSSQIGTAQSTADTALANANAALAKDPTLTLAGDASGSATFTNLGNATLTVTVADDSHNHTIANVDGLQTALDGKVDDSQVLTNVPAGAVFTDTVYTHPTYAGDDFSVDTGPLTGATVVSDIDINVTTDTLGHVTDANASVATRTLTLANLGYTGATNANYYTHPSYAGDDINLDTGPLTGATVISDLDFNVTTDTQGHVTDANATYSTRNLTYSDVGAAAASHTHDNQYYTESEIQTFLNRSYINSHSASNLAVGWYTIATNSGDRATARFGIWDVNSSDHQSVIFYAAHNFGTDSSNTLTVLDNSFYSGNPFRYIRIKDGGTYDGAALQIYIDDSTNAVNCAIVGDNFQSSGWVLCDWIPDATTPPNVSNYASFGERSKVDLNLIAQGGLATTGEIYAGGDTTQYRVFHDGYHPNADKWTTARTLSLTGDVTGSVSWDGSGNASLTATVADDSHTHDGRYYTESESNSRFTRFINDATLNSSTDTASFISELSSEFGCFAGNAVTLKCSWSYAGNSDLNTGHSTIGTIELAGCTIETWGGTYKHVRITRPNTGTGGHCVVEYNDQGSGYSPGWREIWTSESDGSGSGLDADTVDGLHASSFASASHTHSYLPLSGGTLTGTMYGTTVDVSSAVKIGSEVVLQESSDRADLLQITSTTSSWAGLQIRNSSNEGRWSLMTDGTTGGIYDDMSNAWHIQFIDGGETRLYHAGSEKLNTLSSGIYITGNLTASGNVTAYSDKKLKENIEVIPDALAKVSSLSGYTFDRVDMDIPRQTGVIAQEVQAVLPEAVTMDESGTLGVSYGNMVGLLIEAIKEQQAQIDELKSKLEGN